jgi:hypothetical protein
MKWRIVAALATGELALVNLERTKSQCLEYFYNEAHPDFMDRFASAAIKCFFLEEWAGNPLNEVYGIWYRHKEVPMKRLNFTKAGELRHNVYEVPRLEGVAL